jgi:anti-repressor protein
MVNVQTNTDLQTCQSLQITSIHETDKMSSLQIASITGKRHADVMRDIRNLVQQLENDNERNFALVTYQDGKGEQRPMYVLTKKGCLCLASGYDANLRMKIINRWEELERQKQYGSFQVPQTFADALLLAAEQQKQLESLAEQNKLQTQQLKQAAPKVEYFDKALSSTGTYTATQIGKEFGWGAETLNRKLKEMGVQYKQNGQWLLYARYDGKGYTKSISRTYTKSDGTTGSQMQTVFTEKGRLFIHNLLEGGKPC